MANKTLINGTSYNIIKGKTLINGTSYDITKGKTLVNGTSYNIKLKENHSDITLTIVGPDDFTWYYFGAVEVNGNNITDVGNYTYPYNSSILIQGYGVPIYRNGMLIADIDYMGSGCSEYNDYLITDIVVVFITVDGTPNSIEIIG